MSDASNVALTTPGTLEFRDMAIRVVMESCRLVMQRATAGPQDESHGANGSAPPDAPHNDPTYEGFHFADQFAENATTGFGEIFNNIVLHAYGGGNAEETIHCEVTIAADRLEIALTDNGTSFDISAVPPLQEELPQGGMGLYLARAVFDVVEYEPGPPNRWRLVRNVRPEDFSPQEPPTPAPTTEPPAQSD